MKLREIKRQRAKVQFYVSDDIWNHYRKNRDLARTLGVTIDFSDDFIKWFEQENRAVRKSLEELRQKKESQAVSVEGKTNG